MQESGENYLETILILHQKQGYVRSVDIANKLGYSKPSISRAMGILKTNGYITVEPSGNILLTDKGMEKASAIYDRHQTITAFLHQVLGLDVAVAEPDACRIEHVVSQETFDHIKNYMQRTEAPSK
ncbi:MAG: metal-dependent transcriptional regulator [Oscillospiraceae bacterium]|nr:metal-dependent transcriptional regulator [Oscillospiraceae bacterium]